MVWQSMVLQKMHKSDCDNPCSFTVLPEVKLFAVQVVTPYSGSSWLEAFCLGSSDTGIRLGPEGWSESLQGL